ncbi:MAG: hypothetical protein HRU40_10375 [Saprospiraceae bacterium]|nr:hypothetical protein [Saprospiraceae bacterium]
MEDEFQVTVQENHSPYQADMPESLQEVIFSDEIGADIFHSLTPTKQRSIIHMISRIKAITIMGNLKASVRKTKDLIKKIPWND